MTARIYETDGHCHRFTATVLSCEPLENGFGVTLSQTAFFPEGGGQYADTGTLGGVAVTDVQMVNDTPLHKTAAPLPVGAEVVGEIDWEQRFSRMQHHSAEHIISGLVYQHHGLHNVGFHLGTVDTTLDFDGELSREQLIAIEREANSIVAQCLPLIVSFPTPEELATMTYRSKKPLDGAVRIITVPNVDVCACCAPHLTHTGEIGGIKLTEHIRYKGGVRVHMLCGNAAFAAFERLYQASLAAASALSVKTDELPEAVARLLLAREEDKHKLAAAHREWAAQKATTLPENQPFCGVFLPESDTDTLQRLVNAAVEKGNRIAAALVGDDKNGWVGVIGSEQVDLKTTAQKLREGLNARGGGSPTRWQGRLAATEAEITAFLQSL